MKKKPGRTLILLVIPLVLAGLGAACSGGGGAQGAWDAPPLELPAGTRYAAYDGATDSIWILTWPMPLEPVALLTRFEIPTASSKTYTISGDNTRLGVGAGLAIGDSGYVWLAWGRRLLRLDPASGDTEEWTIPDPPASLMDPQGPGLDGFAVDLALSADRAWVVLHSVRALFGLDPSTGDWQIVPIGPVIPFIYAKLAVSGGSLLVNGAIRDTSSFTPALVSVDTASGTASLLEARAMNYAVLADGSVFYIDDLNDLRIVGSSGPALARVDGFVGNGTLTADNAGSIWAWRYGATWIEIVRAKQNEGVSAFAYPVGSGTSGGPLLISRPGPPRGDEKPLRVDPAIQTLLVDKSGDVWVVTAHGSLRSSEDAPYAPLIRLHIP